MSVPAPALIAPVMTRCYPFRRMICGNKQACDRGLVISDLHLFARRSRGIDCFNSIRTELASARILVLNGDIFDFRWSTEGDLEISVAAAIDWLRQLLAEFPHCEIYYVLGNHDCLTLFRDELAASAASEPRLKFDEHGFRLGSRLFVHGDCADQKMDSDGLRRRRMPWETDRQRGSLAAHAYLAADSLGLTRLALIQKFPRQATIERVAHYLDGAFPDWPTAVRDCYFGHTHLPFSRCGHRGVAFHNTGSGIRGMGFNPLRFEIEGTPSPLVSPDC